MTNDLSTTRRAAVRTQYGDTDVVHIERIPITGPAEGEVLVRVVAAGLDRGAWHLMAGRPYFVRPAFGLRRPRNPVLGLEFAGVVEHVGAGVDGFAPGDDVFGTAEGSFTEWVVARPRNLARKPASCSFEEAAVLPVSALTALQALRDRTKVEPGQRVLVIGASGGVGSYAVQMAAAMGAEVTAVCSGEKADYVRSLGAATVLDHRRQRIADAGTRFHVVLDIAGNRGLRELRRVLLPAGRLLVIGGEGGGPWFGGMDRQLRALLWSPFSRKKMGTFVSRMAAADLEEVRQQVESGRLRSTLHRTVPLDEIAAAIDDMVAGTIRGKIALRVAPPDAR